MKSVIITTSQLGRLSPSFVRVCELIDKKVNLMEYLKEGMNPSNRVDLIHVNETTEGGQLLLLFGICANGRLFKAGKLEDLVIVGQLGSILAKRLYELNFIEDNPDLLEIYRTLANGTEPEDYHITIVKD